jgi:hypothetical protein
VKASDDIGGNPPETVTVIATFQEYLPTTIKRIYIERLMN